MRRGREVRAQGFTLVELMIVIAIIAILASIAIPQYLKYQRKARVTTYALPAVRACAMDVTSYCIENPPQSGTDTYSNVINNTTAFPNCNRTIQTPGGQVTLDIEDPQCNTNGELTAGKLNATITNINDYEAICELVQGAGFKCTVVGK